MNKVLRIQSSGNQFDVNVILYRIITIIELEKLEILKEGLFKLDKDKYEDIVNEIAKLSF